MVRLRRNQIAAFVGNDPEAIKAIEALFAQSQDNTDANDDMAIETGNAAAAANEALAASSRHGSLMDLGPVAQEPTILTAGAGLTGGGNLGNNTSLAVGAGAGITANADDVAISTNGVTDSLFRQSAGLSVVGRSANSTGNVADITAASDFQVFRRSGAAIGFGSVDLSQSAAVTGTLPPARGGTGVSNTGTITLGGNLTTSGAFTLTFTVTGNTSVTLPTTGTLATLAGSETFSNKTFSGSTSFPSGIYNSSGNLVLGDTADSGYRLKVAGQTLHKGPATAATPPTDLWNPDTAGDNRFLNLYTETAATLRGYLSYNRAGGTVGLTSVSDRRAKWIVDYEYDSDEAISAISVRKGRMRGATAARPMVVADELQKVRPYCVMGEAGAVDRYGKPVYQTVDLMPLVLDLLAAMKKRIRREKELEMRIAEIEGKL